MLLPTGSQMQVIDREAIDGMGIPSLQLMEAAGRGVAEAVEEFGEEGPVVAVCGKGNNGGDGLVAARLIAGRGRTVHLWLTSSPSGYSGDARVNWERLEKEAADLPGEIRLFPFEGESPDAGALAAAWSGAAVILDALLGTGVGGAPRPPMDAWIEAMNLAGRPIVAVDVPSGVDADTGAVPGAAPLAHLTVTMAYPKLGLLLYPGREHAGRVRTVDIGIPAEAAGASGTRLEVMTNREAALLLPLRPGDSHKGDYGRVFVIAGSAGMMGAGRLVSEGACRAGAGLVRHGAPGSLLAVAHGGRDEVMVTPLEDGGSGHFRPGCSPLLDQVFSWCDTAAVGPGLGRHDETAAFLEEALERLPGDVTLVMDADALNLLAADPSLRGLVEGPLILTPHPGEAARLLGTDIDDIEADRVAAARRLAGTFEAAAVLKGAPTITADPSGRAVLCPLGNPGMSTGGTGDVLTGVLAGLAGQLPDPFEAAALGVYLHALAADLAAGDLGYWSLLAGDIADYLPAAFGYLEAYPQRDVLAEGVWT
ncbi:MAG: NAD(P)H-hydrate dehydratase [bacterium]